MRGLLAGLLLGNLAVWIWTVASLGQAWVLLGAALLTYTLGLRHAVDADHIAAIDNVTRNLVNSGRQPVSVGLMFALGHSSVVFIGAMAIGLFASSAGASGSGHGSWSWVSNYGGLLSALVSTGFLFLIGALNLTSATRLLRLWWRTRHWPQAQRTAAFETYTISTQHHHGRALGFLIRPCLRLVHSSWAMFPIGLLFGIGFETATEIAVLAGVGTQASAGMPWHQLVLFPALFAVGMITVDSLDGILMRAAYGWARVTPARKIYYNQLVSLVSTGAALFVGTVEAIGLLDRVVHLHNALWQGLVDLNDDFGVIGTTVIITFCIGAVLSIWRHRARIQVSTP